jgi:hypothetical protein
MVLFGCDWCKTIKQPGERWILGLAAESIGVTAARREITILTTWDEKSACHPLAVHFCSVEHKDNYMAALFDAEPLPGDTVIEQETTTIAPSRRAQRKYVRTASSGVVTKKKASAKRRRAA